MERKGRESIGCHDVKHSHCVTLRQRIPFGKRGDSVFNKKTRVGYEDFHDKNTMASRLFYLYHHE